MRFDIITGIPAVAFCVIALGVQIALTIVMVTSTQSNQNWLVTRMDQASAQRNAVADALIESWNREPFKEVIVVDTDSNCPDSHPHDLFREVWPGTTHACDCILHPEDDRDYELDNECDKTYKKEEGQPGAECYTVGAIHPIVQNRINGLRVCGAKTQGMTL